jgi:hypothetical protein
MWEKVSVWFHNLSRGWFVLAGLGIFLVFSALVLPSQAQQAEENSGGTGTPDLSFYYSPEDLYQMADAYGEDGRKEYIKVRFTFDLIWPIVYTLFLVTSISWFSRRGYPPNSYWQQANLVPVLAMTFDYLENVSTSLVMYRFPGKLPVVTFLAPIFTSIKWVLVGGSFLLLIVGAVAMILARLRKRPAE